MQSYPKQFDRIKRKIDNEKKRHIVKALACVSPRTPHPEIHYDKRLATTGDFKINLKPSMDGRNTLVTFLPNPKPHESNKREWASRAGSLTNGCGNSPRNEQMHGLLPRGYTLAKSMLLDGSMMRRGEGGGEAPALMMVSPMVACRVERIPCRGGRTRTPKGQGL